MSEKSSQSILVDTSFLITLYDDSKTRKNHSVARKYFKYFLNKSIKIYLSVIVIAEFQQIQPITDIVASGNYITLPYNFEDAVATADVAYNLGAASRKDTSRRAQLKDDLKLMGQAVFKKLDFIITEDERTLARYCRKLAGAKMFSPKVIVVSEGFDSGIFSSGQASLLDEKN